MLIYFTCRSSSGQTHYRVWKRTLMDTIIIQTSLYSQKHEIDHFIRLVVNMIKNPHLCLMALLHIQNLTQRRHVNFILFLDLISSITQIQSPCRKY